jgi:SAM-dependent methyltransferase
LRAAGARGRACRTVLVVAAIPARPAEQWQAFFGHPDYVRFVGHILDEDRTRREVEAIVELLDLRPGSRVLDFGCGHGRIALPLARRGCSVTAVDGSAGLLERARAAAIAEGLHVEFVAADMRDFAAAERFDAVILVGTALGYVEDEAGDADALRAAARSLVPGGRLLLDTENREPKLRQQPRVWFDLDGVEVLCQRRYDHLAGRWAEEMRWGDRPDETSAYSLRLYTAAELRALLEHAGLRVDGLWGELGGASYHPDAPRTVLRGVRG